MAILAEFKAFAVKGNVLDMAVGIIIGAAFTTIVKSFIADILNPILGLFMGGIDFSGLFLNLGSGTYATLAEAQKAGMPTVNYGLFINAAINFVIVALVLFLIIRQVSRLKKEAEAPPPPAPTADVVLLTEIRDLLAGGAAAKPAGAAGPGSEGG